MAYGGHQATPITSPWDRLLSTAPKSRSLISSVLPHLPCEQAHIGLTDYFGPPCAAAHRASSEHRRYCRAIGLSLRRCGVRHASQRAPSGHKAAILPATEVDSRHRQHQVLKIVRGEMNQYFELTSLYRLPLRSVKSKRSQSVSNVYCRSLAGSGRCRWPSMARSIPTCPGLVDLLRPGCPDPTANDRQGLHTSV